MSAVTPLWKKVIWEALQKNIQSVGLDCCCMSLGLAGPSVRTVVFRGFAGENHREELGWQSNCIVITTDRRSQKMQAIQQDPSYEICWYMRGTQEQFRLRGHVYAYPPLSNSTDEASSLPKIHRKHHVSLPKVDQLEMIGNKAFTILCQKNEHHGEVEFDWEAERRRQFALLEDTTRATFSTKQPPSTTLPIIGLDDQGWFVSPDQEDFNHAYENFCILIFTVKEMDYLSLVGGVHKLYKA